MTAKLLYQAINRIIHDPNILNYARFSKKYFTRSRKMSFSDILCFFFDLRRTSLRTRLNLYFKKAGSDMISQQAFSKARNHFDHSPFEKMFRLLVSLEYSGEHALETWHGFHLLAVDGSYLQLPKTAEIRQEFGTRGEGRLCASAGMSVLYDVLHGWPVDCAITHSDMNERTQMEKHIDYLCGQLPHVASRSLVLMDRGYPSADLFARLEGAGVKYLVRCAKNYSRKTQDAPMGDSALKLSSGLAVRVFKFELPSGETETLVTNLFDVDKDELSGLYAMRWGVESMYYQLKNVVCLESFSGRTANAVRQDFWASIVLMVSIAVFQKEANAQVDKDQSGHKQNKHRYKVRSSDLVVTLRDEFIFEVLREGKTPGDRRIQEIIQTLAYSRSPIRPGRSFPRRDTVYCSANLNLKSHL
jgi:hypothetical protein